MTTEDVLNVPQPPIDYIHDPDEYAKIADRAAGGE